MKGLIEISGFLGTGPGGLEIAVLAIAVLILFGPKRLPELARTIGKVLSTLRDASNEFKGHLHSMEDDLRKEVEGEEHVALPPSPDEIRAAEHLNTTPSEEEPS